VRRQLGSKLRQLRVAAGKKVADVTAAGIASKAKMSRIEGGQTPVKMADIRALCWLYSADPETTEALAALAPGTQQEDWWAPAVPEWFGLYAGLEATASRIRCFEPQFVHGLVQTAAYARAVISADPQLSPEVVEQRVRLRLERQQSHADDTTILMGETALATIIGSPELMTEQIAHLRRVAASVRVLPFTAGAYHLGWPFALLDFADAEDPPVAYVEGPGAGRYFDRRDDRAEYERAWKSLMDKSIGIEEWQRE
jgi:transcriptional regulator with XRE-family HTH domain